MQAILSNERDGFYLLVMFNIGGNMKRSHKIALGVFTILAVSGILFASNTHYMDSSRGGISITNQGASVDQNKMVKSVTQDKEGHLTFAP